MVEFVDLEKYPILDLESPAGRELVARCRRDMEVDGSLLLEGFIRADVIGEMAAQVANLPFFHRLQIVGPWLFTDVPKDFPADHPMRKRFAQDVHAVPADQIARDSMLRKVYDSEAIAAFLAAVLQIPKLYQYADKLQQINVMYMKDGCSRAWHYDGSDFVTTLLLQPSLSGGEFEWAPFIRGTGGQENFGEVQQLFDGTYAKVKKSRAGAGALALFSGRRSMHRVRTVFGPRVRIQSVLSYDTKPIEGQTLPSPEKNVSLYGERARAITAQQRREERESGLVSSGSGNGYSKPQSRL